MLFWSFFGDLWMQKRGGIQMFWLFLRKTINERPRMIPSARTWCTPCEISCDSRMLRTGLRLSNLDILRRGLGSTSSDWDWLTPEAWDWYLEQWIFDHRPHLYMQIPEWLRDTSCSVVWPGGWVGRRRNQWLSQPAECRTGEQGDWHWKCQISKYF